MTIEALSERIKDREAYRAALEKRRDEVLEKLARVNQDLTELGAQLAVLRVQRDAQPQPAPQEVQA